MLKIAQFVASVLPSLWLAVAMLQVVIFAVLCGENSFGHPKVYGRFMGGSASNGGNPGRFEQTRHFLQDAESRINADYFACS